MGSPRLGKLDRNYLMNAGFNYAQRAISLLIPNGSDDYVLDRWLSFTGFDAVAASQTTFSREQVSFDDKSEFSLKTSGTYSVGEVIANVQRIESIFARDLINQKVSFLARHKNDGFDTVKIRFKYPAVKDDFSSALTLIHEEIFTVTTDLVNNDLKIEDVSIPVNVANGMQVEIVYIASVAALVESFTSQPKLNIGTKVQTFSLFTHDVVQELQVCRRYYEKSWDLETAVGATTLVGLQLGVLIDSGVLTRLGIDIDFKESKRSIPVFTIWGRTGFVNSVTKYNGFDIAISAYQTAESKDGVSRYVDLVAPGVLHTEYDIHYTADSEL